MAAVHPLPSSRHHHPRITSSSDPFVDPAASTKRPPPPPPKTQSSPKMPAPVPKSAPANQRDHRDITEAVRDTVTVRGNTEHSPRPVGRSQTTIPPASAPRPVGRRSQSQDSGNVVEKIKSPGKSRAKKGSQHADVIDRLDFTGVGPMFHHDGPFDACAPSRNRQRNKAPLFAWSGRSDDLSILNDLSRNDYKGFSNSYAEPPKKKVDAIAEAWGIHEPEPFEEFFAGGGSNRVEGDTPASSIYNGKESNNSSASRIASSKRPKDPRESRDAQRDYLEEGLHGSTSRPRAKRSQVPPPRPIFVPDPAEVANPPNASPLLSSPGIPKRTKSLMHRIRQMREAPNVPVSSDYDTPPSPHSPTENAQSGNRSNRPTHRPQNSFLGRFGGGGRANQTEKSEPFVYIEAQSNKDLPATPPEPMDDAGYTSGNAGLGRKTSLMKKVGKVVGRSRQ